MIILEFEMEIGQRCEMIPINEIMMKKKVKTNCFF
jgi:hypothetical protein